MCGAGEMGYVIAKPFEIDRLRSLIARLDTPRYTILSAICDTFHTLRFVMALFSKEL